MISPKMLANDAALRGAFVVLFGVYPAHWVHDSLLEEAFDELEHAAVGYTFTH